MSLGRRAGNLKSRLRQIESERAGLLLPGFETGRRAGPGAWPDACAGRPVPYPWVTGKSHYVKKGVKIQAYIIDDVLSSMKKLLKDRDFIKTWDETGYSKYHDTYEVFIEVLSYEKMIHDAKIRNATFFDLLMGDLVPPENVSAIPELSAKHDLKSNDGSETAH
jgi:hypothetical protein